MLLTLTSQDTSACNTKSDCIGSWTFNSRTLKSQHCVFLTEVLAKEKILNIRKLLHMLSYRISYICDTGF